MRWRTSATIAPSPHYWTPSRVSASLRVSRFPAFNPSRIASGTVWIDRLEARPELVERKVTADIGAGVEWSVVNELLAQRLAILPPASFAASAVVYLKFFSKNPDVQKAVATLIRARIPSAGMDGLPSDLKRVLSRGLSKVK